MLNLSAIVIVKNGQDVLGDCLDSLSFCDEIIVVDGGSEDKTLEIAEAKKAKFLNMKCRIFRKAGSFALEKHKDNWVLYVDADERVTPELAGQYPTKKIITDVRSRNFRL
jgi:glycosyltransferase involved in cell wall biosynthesis